MATRCRRGEESMDSLDGTDFFVEEEEIDDETESEDDRDCKGLLLCSSRFFGPGCKNLFAGKVVDPKAAWIQEWNRVFMLVCATGLFVDPLFFYTLSVSDNCMCLFVDGWFAVTVTALRCMTDALHVWNMWLQFKMNKRHHSAVTVAGDDDVDDEDEGSGSSNGSRLHDTSAKTVAFRYLKSKKGFLFDLFVILPLPQVSFLCSFFF